MSISSPCMNICQLDSQDVCIGCLRTRDEIARWTRMTEGERLSIIAMLKHRKSKKRAANEAISAE